MKKSKAREAILKYIEAKNEARVDDLYKATGFSKSILHRYLKPLIAEGKLSRWGSPPTVYYRLAETVAPERTAEIASSRDRNIIDKSYLYVGASGIVLPGMTGFKQWVVDTNQQKHQAKLVQRFAAVRGNADKHFKQDSYVDATERVALALPGELFVKKVFYSDFHALPEFGKTKLYQQVLLAKQGTDYAIIDEIAQEIAPALKSIIKEFSIDAVAFLPHSMKRKVQLLPALKSRLSIRLPHLDLVKVFPHNVIVQQKSLRTREERIKNARDTIFLKGTSPNYSKVLLIDDVLGSGASINETAKKLILAGIAKEVYAYTIVGSYNGFDVIAVA